jgi:hypothetical protein
MPNATIRVLCKLVSSVLLLTLLPGCITSALMDSVKPYLREECNRYGQAAIGARDVVVQYDAVLVQYESGGGEIQQSHATWNLSRILNAPAGKAVRGTKAASHSYADWERLAGSAVEIPIVSSELDLTNHPPGALIVADQHSAVAQLQWQAKDGMKHGLIELPINKKGSSRPERYVLIPFAVLADIATAPVQAVVFLVAMHKINHHED